MTTKNKKNSLRLRSYLNKDFNSFRQDLEAYAREYFGDQNLDFSENSFGGMLVELPAYIGDNLSFYLDHQFSELDPERAVEATNIERHLRRSGVKIVGSAPSIASITFYAKIPSALYSGVYYPDLTLLPIIGHGTKVEARNGTTFELTEDVDFTLLDNFGAPKCNYTIFERDGQNNPLTFLVRKEGVCISGNTFTDTFSIGTFEPFRRIILSSPNVTAIESVYDSDGNVYYEVGSLTQNTVFKSATNTQYDSDICPATLKIVNAPYRFVSDTSLEGRYTTLIFGGSSDTQSEAGLPDPSDFAIPLYGKKTFSRTRLDPQKLTSASTLGISNENCVLTVRYRAGGGLSHNVEPNAIDTISLLNLRFAGAVDVLKGAAVRVSMDVNNLSRSEGGEDAPTIDELRSVVLQARNGQERIVSKADLIARVYSLPASFGRVYRAAARSNPNSPLSVQVHIVSRDATGKLVTSSDTLKNNLAKYLSAYRLSNDGIDIVDGQIVDIGIEFDIVSDPSMNKKLVLQECVVKLKEFFDQKNFQIDQPIVVDEVRDQLRTVTGVISVPRIEFANNVNTKLGLQYSQTYHDPKTNTIRGMYMPPPGGIFQVRYLDNDIAGRAI